MNLPEDAAKAVKELAGLIPAEDLAGDGRETNIHITVKYGLHDNNVEQVRELLKNQQSVKAVLGETSHFSGVEKGTMDAVILNVDSPDLQALNKLINQLPHTDTWSEYKPHVTLAYVKLGAGQKYDGMKALKGTTIQFNTVTFSGKDGTLTDIPLLPHNADPSIALSDEYEFDYYFEDADYIVIDEKFKIGVWTPVARWRGQSVEGLEVQAYAGPDGKRRYRTRAKTQKAQKVKPEERTATQVEMSLEKLKEKRKKYADRIQPILQAEESLEAVREDFRGFGVAAPVGHVPDNLEKLLKNSIALQAKLAELDDDIKRNERRVKIRGNKGLLLTKETENIAETKELLELYEDASDRVQWMMKRFFDRFDEWKEQFNIGNENTELYNWHNPDNHDLDSKTVNDAAKYAMLDLKKLPAHLRQSLRVLKDGINFSKGGIVTSSAYPWKPSQQEVAEQGKWAGMYFPGKDGKIVVEYKMYGMCNTIVHEIAHAIDHEVLGISGLSGHEWKTTRIGRNFIKLWKSHLKEFEEYGQTNISEGFATGLTSYLSVSSYMKDHQPALYQWFHENIGESGRERRWRELVAESFKTYQEDFKKKQQITENQSKGVF